MQLNCNGLAARLTELRKRISDEKPQVVLLQETLLKESSPNPSVPGYNVAARQDFKAGAAPNQHPAPSQPSHSSQPTQPSQHNQTGVGTVPRPAWTCRRRHKDDREQWCRRYRAKKTCQMKTVQQANGSTSTSTNTAPASTNNNTRSQNSTDPNPQTRTTYAKQGGVLTLVREDIPFTAISAPYQPPVPDPNTYCVATRVHPPGPLPLPSLTYTPLRQDGRRARAHRSKRSSYQA